MGFKISYYFYMMKKSIIYRKTDPGYSILPPKITIMIYNLIVTRFPPYNVTIQSPI